MLSPYGGDTTSSLRPTVRTPRTVKPDPRERCEHCQALVAKRWLARHQAHCPALRSPAEQSGEQRAAKAAPVSAPAPATPPAASESRHDELLINEPEEAFDLDAEALAADLALEDPVRAYLNEIGHYALLDYEQEQALAQRLALGVAAAEQLRDEPEAPGAVREALQAQIADGEAARQALIHANLRLVVSVAKKYALLGELPLMDLIQEGNIGLMRAADKFDPARCLKFSTYATHWIRQGVNRGRQDQSRTVRLPVHAQEFLYKIHQVQLRLQQRLQREPRPEDLAEALGVRPEKVRQALLAAQGIVLFSTPTGHDADSEFGDLLPDEHTVAPDDAATQQCLREDLRAAVARLPERERRIIELRYGLNDGCHRTLEEVAAHFGITRERIRQIEVEALRKLRHPALGKKLRGYAQ